MLINEINGFVDKKKIIISGFEDKSEWFNVYSFILEYNKECLFSSWIDDKILES